jgi:hypothetical protein
MCLPDTVPPNISYSFWALKNFYGHKKDCVLQLPIEFPERVVISFCCNVIFYTINVSVSTTYICQEQDISLGYERTAIIRLGIQSTKKRFIMRIKPSSTHEDT